MKIIGVALRVFGREKDSVRGNNDWLHVPASPRYSETRRVTGYCIHRASWRAIVAAGSGWAEQAAEVAAGVLEGAVRAADVALAAP